MNNIDKQYLNLLKDIIDNGIGKKTRNGETITVFGRQIRHKMNEGFPLLTTKKMAWKQIVNELLWFLRGDTNIKYLVDNDCHIWDGDAYKNYAAKTSLDADGQFTKDEFIQQIKTDPQFAKVWGELGSIYGKQWRSWHTGWDVVEDKSKEAGVRRIEYGIDQIANLISELKINPDSRRLMVNAWNVGELDQMILPPCHYGFQVYTRELDETERVKLMDKHLGLTDKDNLPQYYTVKELEEHNIPTRAISLMWNQRSVDTFLGLPFNIASYGLLLKIIAKEVNMVPDELIGNLGDTHLYVDHIDAAKQQIQRRPYTLPKVKITYEGELLNNIENISYYDFELTNYESYPAIKAKLLN